jgi:hypothetical protein
VVDQAWHQCDINTEALKELTYIRAIIKETLRLYSVANGSTSLEAVRNIVIEGKNISATSFWLGSGSVFSINDLLCFIVKSIVEFSVL